MSNMPCWFYDEKALHNTPSIQDGINHKTECEYRKEGANLIIQIGSQMELGYNTLATGVVYFHRFYMFHSFKAFSPYTTACCCLFLAGKAEETPKKSKDVIKIAKTFLSEDKLLALGENVREEVMTMEKILLQTLKFDLKVCHPYNYLLKYAKCIKGNKRRKQKMVQMAWTFINDSLCTTLSIQWEPEIIAIAVMHLAGKLVRLKILGWSRRKRHHAHWWEIFVEDLSLRVVEDICHQVLDIYSPLSRYFVPDSPQTIKVEPKNGTISQLDSSAIDTNMNDAARDSKLESSTDTVISIPLKDPRLENGSVFVKNRFSTNTINTPVLVSSPIALPGNMEFTSSPATPTIPQPIDQTLQDYSQIFPTPNVESRDPREMSRFLSVRSNFNTSAIPSPQNSLETYGNQMFEKGFNNADNQSFANNNNSDGYNDNRLMRNRGFGCANNNYNDDCSENRPTRNRGFRRYDRNNRDGYGPHRFTRRSFENNNQGDTNDHNENRPLNSRGFGNDRNNNSGHNEIQPFMKKGFGNDHGSSNDQNENRPFRNRGFGNDNRGNSRDCSETRPFRNRGFGNDSRGNRSDHNENRFFRNRGFGNDDRGNRSDHNENRNFRNRGFGNDNHGNSNDYNENQPFRNRGFGNNNNNRSDETKLFEKRGFGNANCNNDNKDDESKPFMKRGFGNSSGFDDNCNGNDSRPRMGYHRGNRFQRSDPYPRRFNHNHGNDRYSHNDTNGDLSKGFTMSDAPGKIVDKQRFYHPAKEDASVKVEEEESWD